MDYTMILIVIAIIWYFGKVLNKLAKRTEEILDGSAEMAHQEFNLLKDEQRVSVAERYNALGKSIEKLDLVYDINSIDALLQVIDKPKDTVKKPVRTK